MQAPISSVVSIRDLIDSHEANKNAFRSKVHKLMSENFGGQLENIVKKTLEKDAKGFAIIIERESGNQNNPENPWKWIDNSYYHVQRINQELVPENMSINITTKNEINEIKRLLVESEIDVEDYFVHNLEYHFPMFGGKDYVDSEGDDGVRIMAFSDKVFNKFWKDGLDLYYCGNGEINLDGNLSISFMKAHHESFDRYREGNNEGMVEGFPKDSNGATIFDRTRLFGSEHNYRSWYGGAAFPKYSLLICMY